MKLINNMKNISPKARRFKEMSMGQVYVDEEGCICIKSNSVECLAYIDGSWDSYAEDPDSVGTLLDATISIDGYEY